MRFAYATGSRPLDGYTIKRGVGAGGFGEVYFALSDAGKEVALKRIQRNLDIEIRGVSQCLNLKHPNLVAIFDIRYDEEGQAWVVMEYVRGESMKDVIDRHPEGLDATEALDWFRGIAAGVSYLHDHGIIHRDLKPGNLFLDESVVKIGDYGLSKYISCSRRSGQTESVGTFHYMAPEIGRGVYGKEIDIYALGIILYEMMTGRVPFEGESSQEIIMKHLTATPELGPLPEGLRPVVQRALYKDPEKRYRSVDELLAAVESALHANPARRPFVAHAASRGADVKETLYIGPAGEVDGIYLGPLKQVRSHVANPGEPTVAVHAVPEEPVARAVGEVWRNTLAWWRGPSLTRGGRIILLVLFAILFVTNVGWIMPLAIILGAVYAVYFVIRSMTLSLGGSGRPLAAPSPVPRRNQPVAPAAKEHYAMVTAPQVPPTPVRAPQAAIKRKRWHQIAREQLRDKTAGERLTELTGSMLMSSVVVGVVSLLMLVLAGFPLDESITTWTSFAWLSLTSLAGTWAVLLPAKLWEGVEGDHVRRRFLQLILGLVVGATAFELHQFLGPRLAHDPMIDMPHVWDTPSTMIGRDGSPKLPAYLAYFAGLFALLRWWPQADPLRNGRFSVWSTAATFGVALLWQIFWPFPQPWGLMVPVAISFAVQLSAPWIGSSARNDMRRLAEVT